jgi:SagB-type dehydrogenase family enzyme
MAVEEALAKRRTRRSFRAASLSRATLGQLLWAAQGITSRRGFRTAPSAGARYPIELYVLTAEGVFRYLPRGHRLARVATGDQRPLFWKYVWSYPGTRNSPAIFLFTVVVERTWKKYGRHATRFVDIEVGHAGQNVLLQATALGIWANPIGAFRKTAADLARALRLPEKHVPRYVIAIGKPTNHKRGSLHKPR